MVVGRKKSAIGIGMMLVLTTFVGIAANVRADNLPPVAEANGPYAAEQCNSIELSAAGSYDPEGNPLTYRWNIEGTWYNATSPYYEWTWRDVFSGTITLEVSDGLLTSTDTAAVTVTNMPPIILSTSGSTNVDVGTPAILSVNFFDGLYEPRFIIPSLDTYTATFSWGDGSSTALSLGVEQFWANASHAYATAGFYHIVITITDNNGGSATTDWYVTVNEQLVNAGPDASINEGSWFTSAGYFTNTGGVYTATVDYGDGAGSQSLTLNPNSTFTLSHQYLDNGLYSVAVAVFNNGAPYGSDNAIVTVANVPPIITSLSGPPTDPVLLGTSISLTGVFTDPGTLDTHVAVITWDDGNSTTVNLNAGVYQVSKSHTYTSVGVYLITLTVTDKDGGSDTKSITSYIVVYSPSGGFITGGGWLISPAGSYPANTTLTGRVNFGFVCKYKKGQTIPDGETEFQFQLADINFHSQSYEWLIITGAKGTYQGNGTINGQGHYGFRVTVIDGQQTGGGGVDKLRMKIWDKNNNNQIIYDTDCGAPDTQNPSVALSGGQITIHKA